ncbi:MAG TPA: hypothetical protein VGV10_07925, partial [Thermoleophilaceae bacterium]|nr:hypothetical protein [Thermoleophilaceae bacterium]
PGGPAPGGRGPTGGETGGAGQPVAPAQTGTPAQTGATGSAGAVPRLRVSLSAAHFRAARGKRVQVPFVLSGPAKVTLTVLRGNRVVAKLSTTRRRAGRGLLTWNGKIKRKLAPRGRYKIKVRAVSAAGAAALDAAKLRIG